MGTGIRNLTMGCLLHFNQSKVRTGHEKTMHPIIKERTDLLTEMRKKKYYYSFQGINARYGIE